MSTVDASATTDTGTPDGGEAVEHHHAHDGDQAHFTDNKYIVVAVILGVITAAEVAASYIDLGPVFVPLLLFLMAMKFFIVVSFFMHLRFDSRVFTWMFYSGLFLAVGVYVAALTMFHFWGG